MSIHVYEYDQPCHFRPYLNVWRRDFGPNCSRTRMLHIRLLETGIFQTKLYSSIQFVVGALKMIFQHYDPILLCFPHPESPHSSLVQSFMLFSSCSVFLFFLFLKKYCPLQYYLSWPCRKDLDMTIPSEFALLHYGKDVAMLFIYILGHVMNHLSFVSLRYYHIERACILLSCSDVRVHLSYREHPLQLNFLYKWDSCRGLQTFDRVISDRNYPET